MWIIEQLLQENQSRSAAQMGTATGSGSVQTAVSAESAKLCGPWGIEWNAPAGSEAVLVKTDSGSVCLGTAAKSTDLAPGELRLVSQGGAEIYLKESGEVYINGQRFAPKGGA
ncbi:MAG: hypothetical protein LKE53_09250 [Oscillospiraceae bacterium]|jgi:phage gp45-like|nr:hypothetical protein [Oscillospiraceae bacterium]MDD3260436.1 hypothetical protein [Oscillospiraceae bacterium]